MITTILLTAIGVTVFLQPNAPRLFAAFIFAGLTLCHDIFLSHFDGLLYYGSAALLDLAIIILTSGIAPVPQMVISLHRICMASIAMNFIGWFIWFMYLPPVVYDSAFMFIYAWTLIILIKRNDTDVGGYSLDCWGSCFRFNWRSRSSYCHQDTSST